MSVEFKYNKFDPTDTKMNEIAKELAGNFGFSATLIIDDKLAQLMRVRVSQLKKCDYCYITHVRHAKAKGISDDKISALNAFEKSEIFNDKERACLYYTDAVVNTPNSDYDEAYRNLEKLFTKEEIVDISSCVLNMVFWVHYKLITGHTSYEV